MAYRFALVLILALAASCSPGRRASAPSAQTDAETANRPAQTATQPPEAAGRAYMLDAGAGAASGVPDMERGRKINEQDCTQSIDLTAGNLKCK